MYIYMYMYVRYVYEYEFIEGRNHRSSAHVVVSPPWPSVCMSRLLSPHVLCSQLPSHGLVHVHPSLRSSAFTLPMYKYIHLLPSFPERAIIYTTQQCSIISTRNTMFWQNSLYLHGVYIYICRSQFTKPESYVLI